MKFSVPVPSEYPKTRRPPWALCIPRYNMIKLGAHALFYVKHEYDRKIKGVRQPNKFFIRVESMEDYNILMEKVREQSLGCEFVHFYHIPWETPIKEIREMLADE